MRAFGWQAAAVLAAMMLAGCQTGLSDRAAIVPDTVPTRTALDQSIGDKAHAKVLKQFGGAYRHPKLQAYVTDIGQRLVDVSEQPDEKWTFTVLDSPKVNAFALPGGYVYVTRGLVALAQDEAELAGVIGHEIGHVTAGHSGTRRDRGKAATIGLTAGQIGLAIAGLGIAPSIGVMQAGQLAVSGVLARYSRADELEADNLGIRYLARAGYDPYAQADFLDSMKDSASLDAEIAEKRYNANRVGFFGTHPATGPRTRRAIDVARTHGEVATVGEDRGRERYLQAIDGMSFGNSEAQGFVNGQTFSHPVLRFTFDAPEDFAIIKATRAIVAEGPENARFILEGGRNRPGPLTDFIQNVWLPGLAKTGEVSELRGLEAFEVNGLPAARAEISLKGKRGRFDALLVAVRLDGALYRITGLSPKGADLVEDMEAAVRSFRRLDAAEAKKLKSHKLVVVDVRPGDTVESMIQKMSIDVAPRARFLVLNGLTGSEALEPGQKIKLIR